MTSRQHAQQAATIHERAEKLLVDLDTAGVWDYGRLLAIADRHIAAALAEQEAEQWIDVREKLPEADVPVLAVCVSGNGAAFIEVMSCGQEASGELVWYEQDGDFWGEAVTHWRALPAPPANTKAKE